MLIKHLDWYCVWLIDKVPHSVYLSLSVVLCIGIVALLCAFGVRRGLHYSLGLLLSEYVFLLFGSTVFFRHSKAVRVFDMTPFWSYRSYLRGEDSLLLPENIMNVVVFVPVGLLLGLVFRFMSWKKALLIGACLSVSIELMQFVLKRGFAEFDDVMHNTAGCLIGYGIYIAIEKIWIKMKA